MEEGRKAHDKPLSESRARDAKKADKANRKPTPWTRERKDRFLAEFRKHGRLGDAAQSVGCSRSSAERKRKQDPEFDAECEEAWKSFQDWTIKQVQDHAWGGKPDPVFHMGEEVGHRTVYSARMQELEARRVVPGYREKSQLEVTDSGTRGLDLSKLSTEKLATLKALLGEARPDRPDTDGEDQED